MQKTVNSRNHGLVLFNPEIGRLSCATTPGKSGPGSDGNEGVLCIPQSSSITGTSPLDCLMSYPSHSLVGGGLNPLQRSSRCIQQPQPNGQSDFRYGFHIENVLRISFDKEMIRFFIF